MTDGPGVFSPICLRMFALVGLPAGSVCHVAGLVRHVLCRLERERHSKDDQARNSSGSPCARQSDIDEGVPKLQGAHASGRERVSTLQTGIESLGLPRGTVVGDPTRRPAILAE